MYVCVLNFQTTFKIVFHILASKLYNLSSHPPSEFSVIAFLITSIHSFRGLPLFLPSGEVHSTNSLGHLLLATQHIYLYHVNLFVSAVLFILVHIFILSLISTFPYLLILQCKSILFLFLVQS